MIKNINDLMNNLDSNELDTFFANTDADLVVKTNIKETKLDNTWLEVLEDSLTNIDVILRNPRRFITTEEDVLVVEKTKKISQETIKHLSEHCENIQDMDSNGDVIPKKLLNIHKEDTTDLYENRFIFTLVKRLDEFIGKQLQNINETSKKEIKKEVNYNAKTKINNKVVKMELKLEENDEINTNNKKGERDFKSRILSCYEIIKSFQSALMIKSLANCTQVANPIRKTNLILREPNFQKALILWDYLNNFEYKEPKIVSYSNNINSSKEIKDEYTLAYFVDCNAIDESKENLLQDKNTMSKLNKVIDEYVYNENNNLNEIIETVKQMYSDSIESKNNRLESIQKIYNDFFNNYSNKKIELNKILN